MSLAVRRRVELDLPIDELWPLIAPGPGWRSWLVDGGAADAEPGATGVVVLDGEARAVLVRDVVEGERVVFDWSPADGSGPVSTVTIELDRSGDRPAVEITETLASSADPLDMAMAWEVRLAVLWVRATLGAPVPA